MRNTRIAGQAPVSINSVDAALDALGRVTAHKQALNGWEFPTYYTYNLAGMLLEETYPSARVVKNTIGANGNMSQVETKPSGGSFSTRANNFVYNAPGAVQSMQLGNSKYETTAFNARLQPTQIGLGTSTSDTSLLKLEYGYGTTANNGNVVSQKITVPGVTYTFDQAYTYDSLNRIASATENYNGSQLWTQVFGYDRYGNRNITSGTGATSLTFNASNNRITSGTHAFDSAGNMTVDAVESMYSYDGENKQTKVLNLVEERLGEYFYDGDGKRVKKIAYVSDTPVETTSFLYDAFGKLIEERDVSGNLQTSYVYAGSSLLSTEITKAGGSTSYLTADHLGSPRINTNGSGTVIDRHDYMPFGEEIFTSLTSQRTFVAGYTDGDEVRKQFTGYERDGETGLDFAQARYFGSPLGRFTSPDRFNGARIDPQSLNLYSYVLNNPLKFIDPSGYCGTKAGSDGECIWLAKNGEYQSVSKKTYGDGGGFKGWSVVTDIDSVTLDNPTFTGDYANVDKYRNYQANGITVKLGSNGMFYGINNSVVEGDTFESLPDEPGAPQGYFDANANASTAGVGITGGTMFNGTTGRPAPYVGIGFFSPGSPIGGSLQYSPDSISGGFNAELSVGAGGVAGNIGVDEAGNVFQGFGPGSPGASLTFYYVFNAPKPPIVRGPPTTFSRQNSATNVAPKDVPKSVPNCACNVPR